MNKRKIEETNPILSQKFKQGLHELMDKAGTQEAFGKLVGISRGTLAQYYNYGILPKADSIFKICSACHVSADWLLGLSKEKTPDPNIQAICEYTGLSEKAVEFLHNKKDDPFDIPDFQDGFTKDVISFSDLLNSLIDADPDKLYSVFHSLFDTWLIDRNQKYLSDIGGLALVNDTSSLVLSANQALDFKLYDTCQKFRELLSDIFIQLDEQTKKGE